MHKGAKLDDYMVFRRRAIELYQQGEKQKFIVKALGVSQPTVSRWISEFKTKGEAFLERPKIGGSKRKLTPDQLEELTNMLDEGAEHHGFEGNLWTRARVKKLIERCFGVVYAERSISDLLRDLGYTLQKPDRRSYAQAPERVRQWREETLPALKKKPKMRGIRSHMQMKLLSAISLMCKELITARGSAASLNTGRYVEVCNRSVW